MHKQILTGASWQYKDATKQTRIILKAAKVSHRAQEM